MRRPRIKPEHAPYRTTAGNIRIGGGVHGIAAEITDPGKWLWSLVAAIDGTAVPDEIVGRVRRAHPDAAEADVLDALESLIAAGYVEDAAAGGPDDFSPREQQRYRRGMQFYRWVDLRPRSSPWDVQRLLRNARVVLVGVGGTGSSAALALAASGIGRLHCVDPDVVEPSNLNRQVLYTERDLGRPKVAAAVTRLRQLNSDIEITGERARIGSPEGCAAAIAGCCLLALCADQQPISAAGRTGPAWLPASPGSTAAITGRWSPRGSTSQATGRAGSACARASWPGSACGRSIRAAWPGRCRGRRETPPRPSPPGCPGSSSRTWPPPCSPGLRRSRPARSTGST